MKSKSLIEAEKYRKAFETLAKAERLAEKAKSPDLMCNALLQKGEVLDATQAPDEALKAYEKALEISSDLFLNDPQDSTSQKYLYNSIALAGTVLTKVGSVSEAKASYERTNKYFDGIFEAYEKLLTKQPENPEYFSNCLKTLGNSIGYFLNFGYSEKQFPFIISALSIFQKLLDIQPKNLELYQRLDIHVKEFGKYLLNHGLFEDAKNIYEQLQEIYRTLLEKDPGNGFARHYLAFSYCNFGDLYLRQGKLDKIDEIFPQAFSIVENNLSKDPENTEFIVNRAEIYEEFGMRFSEVRAFEKANRYYEKALENFEMLIGKRPNDPDYQNTISNAFNDLGELFGRINHIENAKKCYLRKIEIKEYLLKKDSEAEGLRIGISNTFMQIGDLYKKTGETETAKQYYEKAIEGYESLLAEDPEETEFELSVAYSLNSLGDLYVNVGSEDVEPTDEELETAREYYKKALKINEKAFGLYPDDNDCRDDFILTLDNLGDSFAVQDRYEDAIPFYRRIIEIKEQVVRDKPENWMNIKTLGNYLDKLGAFYGEIGDTEMEAEQYSKTAELHSILLHDENLPLSVRQMLAIDVQFRGIEFLNSRKLDSAKEALDLALAFFESLYEKDPEAPENYPFICEALHQSGKLQEALRNFEEAAVIFDSLLPVVEKLLKSDPEKPEFRENAGITYTNAGEVYSHIGDYEKSNQAFENALTINEALLAEEPDNPIYQIYKVETLEKYAGLLFKLGRNEEAKEFTAKAEEMNRILAEECEEKVEDLEECGEKVEDL
ncbi:MAG: tetratricopeptide repeat protein [Methanosarcinaceae archaeon]|nr:tetratricopeptide repeat protein [Methanosarcinaceae archaeon]